MLQLTSGSGPTPCLLTPMGVKAIEAAIKGETQRTTIKSWKAS